MADTDNNPLPEDLIYDEILTRLPVKSLLRFKSVCKTWESVISSSGFIKSQVSRAESDPQHDYVFLHAGRHPGGEINDELLIVSPVGIYEADIMDDYDDYICIFDIVGSVNGLICVYQGCDWSHRYNGQLLFHIWNPATKRVVSVQHHIPDAHRKIIRSSMGYDPLQNDYKIICTVHAREGDGDGPSQGYFYSINAGCWRQVHFDVEFPRYRNKNCVVNLNGCPYWMYDESGGFHRNFGIEDDCLSGITFDVQNNVFRLLPQLFLPEDWGSVTWSLMNWKGSLCTLIYKTASRELDFYCLKLSSSGGGGSFWSKIYAVGSFKRYPWLCFKNGDILLDARRSEWLSHDHKSCAVKSLGRSCYSSYGISAFPYIESLVFVKGMKPCVTVEFLR